MGEMISQAGQCGRTSLVLPTFNPGPAIQTTWDEVIKFVANQRNAWEVLFVCDGCTDDTPEVLRKLAAAGPAFVRVLSHWPNRGKGYALRRGLEAATGDYRIFTDVDLAYGLDQVEKIDSALRGGKQVAIASRSHAESTLVVPAKLQGHFYWRHIQSLAFCWMARCLLGFGHRDTQAGLKGMSKQVALAVVPLLKCDGFGFDCELLAACRASSIAVTEVPITVRYRDKVSTTSRMAIFDMIRELLKVRNAIAANSVSAASRQLPAQQRRAA